MIDEIKRYKIGTYENFSDALSGEIESLGLNVALMGITGSGKSALINTIFECLGFNSSAVTQDTAKEGTRKLDSFPLPGSQVTFYDTAGFFRLGKIEEGIFLFISFLNDQNPEAFQENLYSGTGTRG